MIKKILKHLRAKIFAGILVILPLGITFLILNFVFNALHTTLDPLMPKVSVYFLQRDISIPGLGIIGFFVLLYLIGMVTTNVLGRKLVHWTHTLFTNIPVVKNIYSSSKQLTDAFSATKKGSFRQAVFVEFPQAGNFVLGFITNELTNLENEKRITVFVPTGFAPPVCVENPWSDATKMLTASVSPFVSSVSMIRPISASTSFIDSSVRGAPMPAP